MNAYNFPLKQCAKCGACTAVCPVYSVTGRESLTARGKLHLFNRLDTADSKNYGDILSQCLLCGACAQICPRDIDIADLIISARANLPRPSDKHFTAKAVIVKTLGSAVILAGLSGLSKTAAKLVGHLPKHSGLKKKLSVVQADLITKSRDRNRKLLHQLKQAGKESQNVQFNYFGGCLANHLYQDIASATALLNLKLTSGGLHTPGDQTCCGLAALGSGRQKEAKKLAKKNITAFSCNFLPILTSCASCFAHLKTYPQLFVDEPAWHKKAINFTNRVYEFSTFFNDFLSDKTHLHLFSGNKFQGMAIFYHDPCHLRFGPNKISREPRKLINKITNKTVKELSGGAQCCGQGGLFYLAHPDLSSQIFSSVFTEFKKLKSHLVVTTCSGCLLQWQQGLAEDMSQAEHLAILLAESLGE